MIYEYVLELETHNSFFEEMIGLGNGIEPRVCWGKDEYDALTRFISSYKNKLGDSRQYICFCFSRLRPTGRKQQYPYNDRLPYFKCQCRPYIKGLITRFMSRFLIAETLPEISGYKDSFEEFLERYKDEFPEEAVYGIYNQYYKRLAQIQSGSVKLPKFELIVSSFNYSNTPRALDECCNQAVSYLRSFGCRVENTGDKYVLTVPKYYDILYKILDTQDVVLTLSPLDLIAKWLDYRSRYISSNFKRQYQLSESPPNPFSYLGTVYGGDTHLCYTNLKKKGIIPIIQERDSNSSDIYVLSSHQQFSQDILDCQGIELDNLNYDGWDDWDPSDDWGSCDICGSSTYSGSSFCSVCENNMD